MRSAHLSNNMRVVLDRPMSATAQGFDLAHNILDLVPGVNGQFVFMNGCYIPLTIARLDEATQREVCEIVHAYECVETIPGERWHVSCVRAREHTEALDWAAGAVAECRLTASTMVGSFIPGVNGHSGAGLFDSNNYAISLMAGYNVFAYKNSGDSLLLPGSWSIGGIPVNAQMGANQLQYGPISSGVMAYGETPPIELGVADDFDPDADYHPGEYAKDPATQKTYGYGMSHLPGERSPHMLEPIPGLASFMHPWQERTLGEDNMVGRAIVFNTLDIRLHITELGFILQNSSATTAPEISVGESKMDLHISSNSVVSATELDGLNTPHQRIILKKDHLQGVQGLSFHLLTAAQGGSFRGRFYWRGFFQHTQTGDSWIPHTNGLDGTTETSVAE